MEVIVETESGSTFAIELDSWDTLLDIKKKIEMSLGFPVSKQTLSFKGTLLLRDDLYVQQYYNIVHKSRLHLFSYHEHQPNQALRQAEQSPVPPSNSMEELLEADWASWRSNDDQVVHQTTEQSPASFYSIEEFLLDEDLPSKTQETRNMQSFWPVTTEEAGINIQDPWGRNNSNQDLLRREPSPPSNSFGGFFGEDTLPLSTEHFSNIQSYWPVSTEEMLNNQDLPVSSNQVLETEQCPRVKEVINIQDPPVRRARKPPQKLRVMMLPYSREGKPVRKFPVEVDASENVEEVRKELEKMQQRSQLNLPKEGYFFIHKQRVLDDDQSFRWNGVAHGDTVEIFPGHVTRDGDTNARFRKFGV